MPAGWNFIIDGSNASDANKRGLVRILRALRPARLRFHRDLPSFQGTPSAAGGLGLHGEILHRLVDDISSEGSNPPPKLDYYPHVQMVIGYGPELAATPTGFLWAQLAGFEGIEEDWTDADPTMRDSFLEQVYPGYDGDKRYFARPPQSLWPKMLERFNEHIDYIYSYLAEDAGWPVGKQWVELWNEANPSGVGGKGVDGTPWAFDDDMLPMLDYFARQLELNPDGRGRRKLIASTLVAWYGSCNPWPYAPEEINPTTRLGGETPKSLRAIDEWRDETANLGWHGLFDAISLNCYAPLGDIPESPESPVNSWGYPTNVNVRAILNGVEMKVSHVMDYIRAQEGSWFQNLPVVISESSQLAKWCGLGVGRGRAMDQTLLGTYRKATSDYMCERFGEEYVCNYVLNTTETETDLKAFNIAQRVGTGSEMPACFKSARPFLTAAGWDASGSNDPNGRPWLG